MAHQNRGVVRLLKKDLAGAVADLNRAIKLDPRLAEAYFNRGAARLLQGNATEAQQDFGYCLALAPHFQPQIEQFIKETKQQSAPRG